MKTPKHNNTGGRGAQNVGKIARNIFIATAMPHIYIDRQTDQTEDRHTETARQPDRQTEKIVKHFALARFRGGYMIY